jgi:vacuolar-type H+-ATPase subunit I/STV1
MSDVDKELNTAPEAEGTPEATDTKPEPGTTPEEESTSFYKSELEKTKAELEKAKYTLSQKRLEEKEVKDEIVKDAPEQLTQEDIDARFEAKIAERESKKLRESLPTLIEDKDTLAKVEYYLDNRVVPSGKPEEDIQLAMQLANAGKLEVVNGELIRALKTKPKGTDLPGTVSSGDTTKQLSQADKDFLAKIGVSESEING